MNSLIYRYYISYACLLDSRKCVNVEDITGGNKDLLH